MAQRPDELVIPDGIAFAPPTGRRESTSLPLEVPDSIKTESMPAPDADVTRTAGGPGVAAAGPRSVPGYEVLEELGRGGMGLVYRARDLALNRVVALKMVLAGAHARDKDLERFRAEARAVARFQHPNIVQIHEVGEADGLPYLALEFVPGGTLARKIARDPQDPRYSAATVEALARAMQYAHERGVVHRDLKPSNVLLAEDGTPKVTDFGLAKRFDDDSQATRTGQVLGTPSYMAPEQAGGQAGRVGPATDVYALGATLYDLLTGRPPFAGAGVLDTLEMVRTREPVPPGRLAGRLPPDLDTITLKCLQKDPAQRYPTAGALADDLRRFLDGRPILARPVGPVERAWRWARRNPWVAGLGSAVAVLLLAVAAVTSVLAYHLSAQKAEAEATARREQAARVAAQELEQKAVAAQQKAERAAAEERAARQTTTEQRRLALDTVRGVLLRVDELMKNDARLAPLRVEIIRRMLTDVDNIRDHALKNPLEDRTEALAYSRMGEIYFRSNRITNAAEWLTKAHAVLKAVADDAPTDPAALRNLAAACHALADAEWRLGRGARSRELHAEGLRLRQLRVKLVAGSDSEMERADAAQDVADSLQRVAYDDLRLGRPALAAQGYRESDRAYAALPEPMPNFLTVRRIRSEIRVRLADALSRLGQPDDAQRLYLEALTDREALAQSTPRAARNAALLAEDVGQSRMYLGDFFLMARHDPTTATFHYVRALDDFAGALADDPDNLSLRQRVAATHYRLGLVSGRRPGVGLLAGAAADLGPLDGHHAESLKRREALAKIDPTDTQGQVEVLLSYARMGQTADVERVADRMMSQAGKDPQVLFQTACGLSIVAAGTGEPAAGCRDRAFRVLDTLLEGGWEDRFALETDPDLDAVRADKRFAGVLKKLESLKPDPG